MLLSSQNIDYNSANKFKCLLNSENPEVCGTVTASGKTPIADLQL
jgi:hypothetical protein